MQSAADDLPLLIDGPSAAAATLVLAHGAGAGMEHAFMQRIASGVAAAGIRVVRFEFPYMAQRRRDGRKRPPDRMPLLLAALRGVCAEQGGAGALFIGGKSMGGRVASLLAAEPDPPAGLCGVICLGFPFHPPGKPDNYRGAHLAGATPPTLILQGERDPFGTRVELAGYPLGPAVECQFIRDGEHSFKPRRASGTTLDANLDAALVSLVGFIQRHSGG